MIHVKESDELYAIAGFNGCIGSIDATHVPMLSYPLWESNSHKGFKLNLPARTYNVTVDHCRRILGSTSGHPGSWNDKTLVLFDELIIQVNDGQIPNDFIFKLLEKDNKGEVVEVFIKVSGLWLTMDTSLGLVLSRLITMQPGMTQLDSRNDWNQCVKMWNAYLV